MNKDNQCSGFGTSQNGGVIFIRIKSLREYDVFHLLVCCKVLVQPLNNAVTELPLPHV